MIPFDEFGKKLDAIRALLDKDPASNEPMKLMCDLVGDMAKRLCEMDSAIDALDEFTENIDCRLDMFEESLDELDCFEDDSEDADDLDRDHEEDDKADSDDMPFTCTGNCADCHGGCDQADDKDDDTVYVDCICPNCGKTFFVDVADAADADEEPENVMFTCPHCQSKVKVILEYDDDDPEAEKDK